MHPHLGGQKCGRLDSYFECVIRMNASGYHCRLHDDVIKWKHFPRYWPFVRGIHRPPGNSSYKGQWRGALMFSLICARIYGWVNNGEAGDLRRNRAVYGVTVMSYTFHGTVQLHEANHQNHNKNLLLISHKGSHCMFKKGSLYHKYKRNGIKRIYWTRKTSHFQKKNHIWWNTVLNAVSGMEFHGYEIILAQWHYTDVIMTTMASQITSLTVVHSIVYSNEDQRKHESSASLTFVLGIHRDRWIPRTKGQLRGKCFHLMTSSWDACILLSPSKPSNGANMQIQFLTRRWLYDLYQTRQVKIKHSSLEDENTLPATNE